jgi:hypothetical protein
MKKILFSFLVVIVMSSCSELTMIHVFHGNESNWTEVKKEEVPAVVFDSFVLKYSNSVVDKWYKVNKNQFIASFQKDNKRMFAIISANGEVNNEYLNDLEDLFGYDEYDDYIEYDNYN